jgi:hypothetical protein
LRQKGNLLAKQKRFDTKSDKVYISVHFEYVASATNCDYYRKISLEENIPTHISNFHVSQYSSWTEKVIHTRVLKPVL